MQISPAWIRANDVWDRVEKGIFLVIDVSLNTYFIYLVRSKLIDNGLVKYKRLYWFNIGMVILSVSLDVYMSLPFLPLLLCPFSHPLPLAYYP
jgi:hypothetical protein